MMYKIFHYLFGWDYIHWKDSLGNQGVSRVYKNPEGVPFYWQYKMISCLEKIEIPSQVTWLTCHPSKYMDKYEQPT